MGDQHKYCIFLIIWVKNKRYSIFLPHRGHHLNGIFLPPLSGQPLPDTCNLYETLKPLQDSHNLYKAHKTSTRRTKPLPDSLNL